MQPTRAAHSLALLAAVGGVFITCALPAATLYYDGDAAGAAGNPPTTGVGGIGGWDASTTANWWNGASYQVWTAAGGQDIADFRGTAATVTLAEAVSVNQLTLISGYTLTGNSINLTGGHTVSVGGAGTSTIASVIAGSSGLTKTGSGYLVLASPSGNSYTGGTTVNAGILLITRDGDLGPVPQTQTVNLTLANTTIFGVKNGSATLDANRTISIAGTVKFQPADDLSATKTLTLAGKVTGTGNLATDSSKGGILVLSNANNDYAGSTTAAVSSTIRIAGGDDRLPVGTTLTINGNSSLAAFRTGTFDLNGNNQTLAGLAGGAGSTIRGKVTNSQASSTSTLTVSGTSLFAGTIEDTGSGSTAGKVALAKSTGGVLTLTAANTYTGATSINGGTLLLNGGSLAAGSEVTVAAAGTLGGSGTAAGTVTVNGTLAPGNSAGILNTGDLTLNGTLAAEVNGAAAGSLHDQVNITGTVALGAASNLAFILGYQPSLGENYTLISNDGSDAVIGTFGTVNGAPLLSGNRFEVTYGQNTYRFEVSYAGGADSNDVLVTNVAIPEPTAIGLLSAGVSLLMVRRRTRTQTRARH